MGRNHTMPWLVWIQGNYVLTCSFPSFVTACSLFLRLCIFFMLFYSWTHLWLVNHCTTYKLRKKKKHQDLCSRWNSCSNCRHKLSGLILGAFSNVFLLVKAAKHPAWHKWVWAHYILGKTLFYNFLCSVAELWLLH